MQIRSTPGLVACYLPYLDGSGQSLTDWSGQGNHAQLGSTTGADTNDPSWGGNALTFDGDDYVTLPNTLRDAFAETTGLTLFTVASSTSRKVYAGIFGADSGSNKAKMIMLDSTNGEGDADFVFINIKPSTTSFTASAPGRLGTTPQMIAGRFIGGVEVSIRKRGTDWSKNTTDIPATMGTPTAQWLIGRYWDAYYLIGSIYAQLYFNRALSDAEVSKTMTNLHKILTGQGVTIA